MDVIAVKGLDFSYGNTQILKNINFTVPEGRFAVLLGPNGAGKSTLIKLMLGELPLSGQTGKIELLGQEIRQFKDWKKISYVSQNGMASCQNFPASVEEFVQAGLYTQIGKFRFAGKREREQVRRVLHQVGMGDFAKRLIGRLSGGQQQRVLLARALINAPRLLLLCVRNNSFRGKNPKYRKDIPLRENQRSGISQSFNRVGCGNQNACIDAQ